MFVGWVMIASWLITGERQAAACRKAYFATLLKQEIGWFDCVNQSELSSNFSSDTLVYQGAIG
jgi:ATP-binding cassette, subfamily B (MDR/TAP), member 1